MFPQMWRYLTSLARSASQLGILGIIQSADGMSWLSHYRILHRRLSPITVASMYFTVVHSTTPPTGVCLFQGHHGTQGAAEGSLGLADRWDHAHALCGGRTQCDWRPLLAGLLYIGFSAFMFGLYSFMPLVMKRTSATAVNLSLLTADLYSLFCGLFLFHYQVTALVFVVCK